MDIVDEDDVVVGQATRDEVHRTQAIHRGVHVLVVSPDGRDLLLQKRAASRADYPGHWDASVGGQVLAGESYEAAAERELAEELGCRAHEIQLLGKYDAFSDRQREKRAVFVTSAGGPFEHDEEEVEDVRFVAWSELSRLLAREPSTEGLRRTLDLFGSLARSARG